MSEALIEARNFVEAQYQTRLDLVLQSKLSRYEEWQNPVWEWHDENLVPLQSESDASGAVIADPEIGVCLLLQRFSPSAELASQIKKALQYRSAMLPSRRKGAELKDRLGEWRVVLYWLCELQDVSSWISQISFLRQETAYFEEIPVDVVINTQDNWRHSIAEHEFPRLLFNVREAVRKDSFSESLDWASADNTIERFMRRIPDQIDNQQELEYVHLMLRELDRITSGQSSVVTPPMAGVRCLNRIHIENFRNIDKLTLDLGSGSDQVCSHVFQGPNGSGKSSIVEAISFATLGFSSRYLEYMEDANVPPQKKPAGYVSHYLKPLSSPDSSMPRLALNDNELIDVTTPTLDEATRDRRILNATFLNETGRSSFVTTAARDLGREVAESYSSLAADLHDYVTMERQKAEESRKSFNRSWNIQTIIVRASTARSRILAKIIKDKFQGHQSVFNWLQNSDFSQLSGLQNIEELRENWSRWVNDYEEMLEASGRRESVEGEDLLTGIGGEYRNILVSTITVINKLRNSLPELDEDLEANIEKYSVWLAEEIHADDLVKAETETKQFEDQLDQMNKAILNDDANRKFVRRREEHLEGALEYLAAGWTIRNDRLCPTCESDLTARGGAKQVVESLLNSTTQDLKDLDKTYSEKVLLREQLEKTIKESGLRICPISRETIQDIEKFVHEFLNLTEDVSQLLLDSDIKNSIVAAISSLQNLPQISDLKNEVEQVADMIDDAKKSYAKAATNFDKVSSAPDIWKSIEKHVVDAQSAAVMDHLPKTVQALWRELAQNLTSALWQYPASAEFRVRAQRGETEARIMLEGSRSLAAHILNGAEIHNLGLAWFFTRYLTFGKFGYAFLVLDNPAQHMDQPTYRDMCRLLESILRLHRRHCHPLTMLTFLHQDSRALDAARATNGTLHLLRWNKKGTPVIEQSMRLLQDEYSTPYPAKVLAIG